MGNDTRTLMTKRLRRRRLAGRAFDVFIFVAFWAAIAYIALT
jgi:hypothetical protein